jgi:hypothetical protein
MKVRTAVVLVVAGGVGFWIYKSHPTVHGLVDGLTAPLMESKAAVKESEYRRVQSLAVPAAHEGEQVSTQTIREGMKRTDVEELLGKPDRTEALEEDGHSRLRWTYVRAGRVIVFENARVVSIAVR